MRLIVGSIRSESMSGNHPIPECIRVGTKVHGLPHLGDGDGGLDNRGIPKGLSAMDSDNAFLRFMALCKDPFSVYMKSMGRPSAAGKPFCHYRLRLSGNDETFFFSDESGKISSWSGSFHSWLGIDCGRMDFSGSIRIPYSFAGEFFSFFGDGHKWVKFMPYYYRLSYLLKKDMGKYKDFTNDKDDEKIEEQKEIKKNHGLVEKEKDVVIIKENGERKKLLREQV